jgi:hypothetical protein
VTDAGLTEFERIGVAVARGTAAQLAAARAEPGVSYLEGNSPIAFTDETSNAATRGAAAVSALTTAYRYTDGAAYTPVGSRTTSYDKGAGLVDVVAAVQALRG